MEPQDGKNNSSRRIKEKGGTHRPVGTTLDNNIAYQELKRNLRTNRENERFSTYLKGALMAKKKAKQEKMITIKVKQTTHKQLQALSVYENVSIIEMVDQLVDQYFKLKGLPMPPLPKD